MSSQWQQISANLKSHTLDVVRASVVKLGTQVVQDTPVDKGMLINNWLTGVDNVDNTQRPPKAGGSDSITELTQKINLLNYGVTIYFSNPMPYASRIEYEGYSQKAPAGMLRKNVINWPQILETAARQMKK